MPLFKDLSTETEKLLIWKYSANDGLDEAELFNEDEKKRFARYHPKKLSEALMVRKMLKTYFPDYKIVYNKEGEPALEPPELKISITHSYPFAAISVSKYKTGIDLEPVREKIVRVKHKFIFDAEQTFIPKEQETLYLTVIWSIKECLYKIHHTNYWSLKRHYEVKPFILNDSEIKCRVYDDHFSDDFTAKFWCFQNLVFTLVK